MKSRDYTHLMAELAEAYSKHSPKSATLNEKALKFLIDGGSNVLRTIRPFPPRIVQAKGAWVTDEDGHKILDFWQGHYANVMGHNPEVVSEALAHAFAEGFGLQTGFTDSLQVEAAEIICRRTGAERIRFTTSGTLATMNAMMLARAFTNRELVMKVGGGWHGGHPWGLKGVGYNDGFQGVDSEGLSSATDTVLNTGFNDTQLLEDHFRAHGDKVACFILEPVIGAGGMMPATREYVETARKLTEKYGALLILDEVISAFRFRAGNVGHIYGVQPDLTTMGKAIGGGMPVAAVAGRADILNRAGLDQAVRVKFQGGTSSAHPASMLAAKTFMSYLVENEGEIYPRLARIGRKTREVVTEAFEAEDIHVRFAGDRTVDVLPGSSLHMLLFPFDEGLKLNVPEEVRNPAVCDLALSEKVLQLVFLLENVYTVHGIGCTTVAHSTEEIEFLGNACRRAAKRIKPYL